MDNIKKNIEDGLFESLKENEKILSSVEWGKTKGFPNDDKFIGALKSFESSGFITLELVEEKAIILTDLGEKIVLHGSPEFLLYKQIPKDAGIEKEPLMKSYTNSNDFKTGFSEAMKMRWIKFDKSSGKIFRLIDENIKDIKRSYLQLFWRNDDKVDVESLIPKKDFMNLKKQKYIVPKVFKSYVICRGLNFESRGKKGAPDLTKEMLRDSKWKTENFKKYNFNSLGSSLLGGYQHPLSKVKQQFREIFLEMGFEEMPTNNYVESSFWNFDTLFQPQQHPARDSHDTFFLTSPSHAKITDKEYLEKVKTVHEKGGYGSIGWRYDWKEEEAKKNIMRTHTTAISSRMLYLLAEQTKKTGVFSPHKYFSIDRVFRNESLDHTHLAEFHQIEGFIVDKGLNLATLIGVLKQFFNKLGLFDLKFKPAYNPYTEPSMEIFAFHPGLSKWVEIGNSGVFRPEMMRSYGFDENISAIAWGLSLERPTMIKYGIDNIRNIFGPKIDLDYITKNPICLLNIDEH